MDPKRRAWMEAELRRLGLWLAHPHWVRERELETGIRYVRVPLGMLPTALREVVLEEISTISSTFGAERAPSLWREEEAK